MPNKHDSQTDGERVANPEAWADTWAHYRHTFRAADGAGETLTLSVLPVQPDEAVITIRVASEAGLELIDLSLTEAALLSGALSRLVADLENKCYYP
jgi:hypothetical protein